MEDNKLGINLRSLLCPEISLFKGDLKIYNERKTLIDEIERRLRESDWISLSDGTTFTKTFDPSEKNKRCP